MAMVARMQADATRAQQVIREAQEYQKQYADRHRREASFSVGDQVLLDTTHISIGTRVRKLAERFCGPMKILGGDLPMCVQVGATTIAEDSPSFSCVQVAAIPQGPRAVCTT